MYNLFICDALVAAGLAGHHADCMCLPNMPPDEHWPSVSIKKSVQDPFFMLQRPKALRTNQGPSESLEGTIRKCLGRPGLCTKLHLESRWLQSLAAILHPLLEPEPAAGTAC